MDDKIKNAADALRPLSRATANAREAVIEACEAAHVALRDVDANAEVETDDDIEAWALDLRHAAEEAEEAARCLRTLAALAPAKLRCWGAATEAV